jgi:hypothetical protein
MPISATYDNAHAWNSSGTNFPQRAYSNITVRQAGNRSTPLTPFFALIDTGADHVCLSDSVAIRLRLI